MGRVLQGLSCRTTLVYLDDVIVLARDLEEELDGLSLVLQRLNEDNLKLNPEKCHF